MTSQRLERGVARDHFRQQVLMSSLLQRPFPDMDYYTARIETTEPAKLLSSLVHFEYRQGQGVLLLLPECFHTSPIEPVLRLAHARPQSLQGLSLTKKIIPSRVCHNSLRKDILYFPREITIGSHPPTTEPAASQPASQPGSIASAHPSINHSHLPRTSPSSTQ